MKKKMVMFLAILMMGILFVYSQPKVELQEFSGTLKFIGGNWFLNTGEDFLQLDIAPAEYFTENQLVLKKKLPIVVKGLLGDDDVILVYECTIGESTLVMRDDDGKPLWEVATAEKNYYVVESSKCIGCRLCVKNCPVGAISMQNGVAVIDADKCINCGICEKGDGKLFKGCPVSAIKQAE